MSHHPIDRRCSPTTKPEFPLRLGLGPQFGFDEKKKNPYIGIIFGYDGISAETVTNQLNERLTTDPAHKQQLPDFVFVNRPGYVVARMATQSGTTSVQGPGRDFEMFDYLRTPEDTLPLFYLALNISLSSIRLRSMDFFSLWNDVFGQAIERARKLS